MPSINVERDCPIIRQKVAITLNYEQVRDLSGVVSSIPLPCDCSKRNVETTEGCKACPVIKDLRQSLSF